MAEYPIILGHLSLLIFASYSLCNHSEKMRIHVLF